MSFNFRKHHIWQILIFSGLIFFSCVSDDFTYLQSVDSDENEVEAKEMSSIIKPEKVSESADGFSSIYVRTDKPKANIYLNQNYQGRSPLIIKNLMPGYYTLTVEYSQNQPKTYTSKYLIEVQNAKVQEYLLDVPIN